MIKIAASAALVVLSTIPSFAQSYCDQVRQGIAQYGYAAARQYAVEHYSPKEVRAADRCVVHMRRRHFERRRGAGR